MPGGGPPVVAPTCDSHHAATPRSVVIHGQGSPAPLEYALGLLAAPDVLPAIPCSRFWATTASSDVVWRGKCQELWAGKVYIPERFQASGDSQLSRLAAYWGSLNDAKRSAITVEELCSFEWSTRMKGWAGPDWTTSDPWWQDLPASTRRYSSDGFVSSTRGGTGASSSRWRFVPEACGCKGPTGSFLRHHAGRDYPTHFVSRWPRNWGWIVQNCWGFSASFPLPTRGVEPELEDDGALCQSVSVDTCRDEAMRFNMGLPLPYEGASEEGTTEDDGFVTVLVNGMEQRLSTTLVAALVMSAQSEQEASSEEEAASDQPE